MVLGLRFDAEVATSDARAGAPAAPALAICLTLSLMRMYYIETFLK